MIYDLTIYIEIKKEMYEASGGYYFGNYLNTLTNMLYFVETTGETIFFTGVSMDGLSSFQCLRYCIVRKANKDWLSMEMLDCENAARIQEVRDKVIRSDLDFYFGHNLPHPFSPPSDANRRRLIHTYLLRFFPPSLPTLPDSHLVMHIRSGDIFNGCYHPKYIQPPLAYYSDILDTHPEYTNVLIITQPDKKNPVLQALLDKYPGRVSIQSTSVDADIRTLLSAKHLVVGTGSFGMFIALSSNVLNRLFCFERHNVWYPEAPYEIVVKGVVSEEYPLEWNPYILHYNILSRDDFIMKTMDSSSFPPYKHRLYWDQ